MLSETLPMELLVPLEPLFPSASSTQGVNWGVMKLSFQNPAGSQGFADVGWGAALPGP